MKFADACGSFLARCAAMNLADGTVAWYGRHLRVLAGFLAGSGIPELGDVSPALLREHLAGLRQRGLSSATVSGIYCAMRCAFGFWRREGAIATDPMESVEKPRLIRALIRPLSAEQAARLIGAPDGNSRKGLRDRAMMMLMLDSGLRLAEVISLETDRLDWLNCAATVMGKGRKERSVPFSERTRQALLDYSRVRANGPIRAPEFFLGSTGKRMSRAAVREMIIRHGRRAGITGVRLSPHTLRHTFAVLYIRNGGDVFSLQQILGHSTLEMSRRYVNLARRDVADLHRKYSPVDWLTRSASEGNGKPAAGPPVAEPVQPCDELFPGFS